MPVNIFAFSDVLIDHPWLALLPALAFAAAASMFRARSLWAASVAWAAYALYELGVRAQVLCGAECNIRVDLLLIWPALWLVSIVAIVLLVRRLVRRKSQ